MVVRSTKQHGSGNRTGGAYVEVGKAHTLLRKIVQYWCVDFTAVTSEV
jgi:hypothetical protein